MNQKGVRIQPKWSTGLPKTNKTKPKAYQNDTNLLQIQALELCTLVSFTWVRPTSVPHKTKLFFTTFYNIERTGAPINDRSGNLFFLVLAHLQVYPIKTHKCECRESNQNVTKRMPQLVKVDPKSSRGAFGLLVCLRCCQNNKSGHGRLVGLTLVKGTSVKKYLHCWKKFETIYLGKRYKWVEMDAFPDQMSMSHW